jgi:hypothetical protein
VLTECSATLFEFARVDGRRVVASFDGGVITSDAGALLLGKADRAVRLTERFAGCFTDARTPELVEHAIDTMVLQRVVGISLGYEDLNDHDELRHDPVLAVLAGKLAARRAGCAALAGKSTLNRLELSRPIPTRYHKVSHDPAAIEQMFVDVFLDAHRRPPAQIILDLDATDDPLHGHQEGRFFHGYYDCYCYLPLYIFCGRHLLAAKLRGSNIDASAGALEEVARMVAQIRRRWPKTRILLRGDSGFARETLMAWCEANRVDFLFGLARNERLEAALKDELVQASLDSLRAGQRRAASRTSCGRRSTAGAATAASLPRRRSHAAKPTLASSSPRSSPERLMRNISTRRSTARVARWRTASRNASSICSPIAHQPPPCVPTSSACGSPRWPTCCSALCVVSGWRTRSLPRPPVAPSASSC